MGIASFAFGMYKLVFAIIYLLEPEKHSIAKLFKTLPNLCPNTNYKIDDELKSEYIFKFSNGLFTKIYITNGWIFYETFITFVYFPMDSVLWIYKNITTHKRNFVETGKSYSMSVKNFLKENIFIQLSEKKCDELIIKIMDLNPHIIYGYSDEILGIYSKDINRLMDIVEERKNSN